MRISLTWCLMICVMLVGEGAPVRGGEPTKAGVAFFEKKIRPVLAAHCLECHSAEKKVRGGLRLDSRAGWEKGGDSGEVIVRSKPEESLLVEVVKYGGDLKMPPKGKLGEGVIRDLEEWIRMGAPDPRVEKKGDGGASKKKREHWAYQPLRKAAGPEVSDEKWRGNAIDRFVFAKLTAEKMKPVTEADRGTLVRRVYFDLWGLPPSPAEIDAFVSDTSPEAWEKLVDRLLASPRFGERWGRHWLDVVRYGESLTLRGFVFPEAWRYRDYVIEAFHSDRPYNRFVVEQIAGDLLKDSALEVRQRNQVATTFLMLGNTNLEEQDKAQLDMDVVDEQLDVIGKSMLGQTIGCARCHDHKFDPITTRDYYGLAGIFKNVQTMEHANVSKWVERPIPLPPEQEVMYAARDKSLALLDKKIQELQKKLGGGKKPVQKRVIPVKELAGVVVDDAQAKKVGAWEVSQNLLPHLGEGYALDQNKNKGEMTLTFLPQLPKDGAYEVRMAYTAASNRSTKTPVTVFSAEGEKTVTINQREAPVGDGLFLSLGTYRFEVAGQCFVIVSNEGTDGHVVADAIQFLPQEGSIAKEKSGEPNPNDVAMQSEMAKLKDAREKIVKETPARGMAMTVKEMTPVKDVAVHIRGSVHNLGEVVSRGVPAVFLDVPTGAFPKDQSGRLELAEWIAHPKHPLTARVMVNRVWHWLFGVGLVRSVDNFGTTGESPSHPELLDALALEFMERDWSVKKLVREIVLSRTYRLASIDHEENKLRDPENRWLWRANRKRLDAECLRDAMLACAGTLEEKRGGPGFEKTLVSDYEFQPGGNRRSVYLPAFRNNLSEFLETFDLADPALVTGARPTSVIAPQALFFMNHPFVREQSRKVAERVLKEGSDDEARLQLAARMILGRRASEQELTALRGYLKREKELKAGHEIEIWMRIVQGLFASSDFRFLD